MIFVHKGCGSQAYVELTGVRLLSPTLSISGNNLSLTPGLVEVVFAKSSSDPQKFQFTCTGCSTTGLGHEDVLTGCAVCGHNKPLTSTYIIPSGEIVLCSDCRTALESTAPATNSRVRDVQSYLSPAAVAKAVKITSKISS